MTTMCTTSRSNGATQAMATAQQAMATAQQAMATTQKNLQQTQQRLVSGMRTNSAKNDQAGVAISERGDYYTQQSATATGTGIALGSVGATMESAYQTQKVSDGDLPPAIAKPRILGRDDVAAETANYAKNQTLAQPETAALAQANVNAKTAMSLLQ